MEKATAPMMHMASSRANMNRMSQSISRSTLLRLLGGSVAFIITCAHHKIACDDALYGCTWGPEYMDSMVHALMIFCLD